MSRDLHQEIGRCNKFREQWGDLCIDNELESSKTSAFKVWVLAENLLLFCSRHIQLVNTLSKTPKPLLRPTQLYIPQFSQGLQLHFVHIFFSIASLVTVNFHSPEKFPQNLCPAQHMEPICSLDFLFLINQVPLPSGGCSVSDGSHLKCAPLTHYCISFSSIIKNLS